jgi:glycosyltransferase involved in cell wall biosynthesis
VPEVINDGQSGLLVAPGASEPLIRALNQLIASAERRRDMGARARDFIVRSAHPDAYRRTLAAAIQRVANSTQPARTVP